MTDALLYDWSEKRAAPRKQLNARGTLVLPGGQRIEVKTLDASTKGFGVEHDNALQHGITVHLALGLLGPDGRPTSLRATAEVRHSVLGVGGRWRTGLQFVNIEPDQLCLLEDVLRPKPAIFEHLTN